MRNLEKARENNQPKIIQPVQPSPVVKPILNPSVKAVLSDDEQTLIGESLKKLGFSDFDLTNTEKSRILYYVMRLKLQTISLLLNMVLMFLRKKLLKNCQKLLILLFLMVLGLH